jgi:hypothetical protein
MLTSHVNTNNADRFKQHIGLPRDETDADTSCCALSKRQKVRHKRGNKIALRHVRATNHNSCANRPGYSASVHSFAIVKWVRHAILRYTNIYLNSFVVSFANSKKKRNEAPRTVVVSRTYKQKKICTCIIWNQVCKLRILRHTASRGSLCSLDRNPDVCGCKSWTGNRPFLLKFKPFIAEHVKRVARSTHRETINAHRILIEKPERNRRLGRHKRRWENNIKMYLTEVCNKDINTSERLVCRNDNESLDYVKNLMTSWVTTSFLRNLTFDVGHLSVISHEWRDSALK